MESCQTDSICNSCNILASCCGRIPVAVITCPHVDRWRNNRQTTASQYAVCGFAVVVKSCASWLLQAEGFTALQTTFASTLQIWTFTVRKLILGSFPLRFSCETAINHKADIAQCFPYTAKVGLGMEISDSTS